jgi:hypothetical protein
LKAKTAASPVAPRTGTKLALLLELLQRKGGATIPEVTKATGWQTHSVRGAISGALKKKLGLAVASVQRSFGGTIIATPVLGGLHHIYNLAA